MKRRIALCTPLARGESPDFARSLRKTVLHFQANGIDFMDPQIVGHANVPRARNVLAATALAGGATDIVFIDSDMGWEVEHLMRLLAYDVSICGGAARRRGPHGETYTVQFRPQDYKGDRLDIKFSTDKPLVEVSRLSTSFLRVRREVFRALAVHHPEWKFGWSTLSDEANRFLYSYFMYESRPPEGPHKFARYKMGEIDETWPDWGDQFKDGSLEGEDYQFSRRCEDLKFKLWCDPTIRLRHWDEQPLQGALVDHAEITS